MKKNNSSATENVLNESEDLVSLIKENTKGTVKELLSEAVSGFMKEEILKDEDEDKEESQPKSKDSKEDKKSDSKSDKADKDEDSDDSDSDDDIEDDDEDFEDEDDDYEDDEDSDDEDSDDEGAENEFELSINDGDEEEDDTVEDGASGEDEWSDLEQYKVGDDEYDLTGVQDADTLIDVFRRMDDDDYVTVRKEGNRLNVSDEEGGNEFVIELDSEMHENTMTRRKPLQEDNLGYTDNYQDKDPIEGLSNEEPGRNVSDWDAGVPKDTRKPWAGSKNGKSKPFGASSVKEEKIFEIALDDDMVDENQTTSKAPKRRNPKTWGPSSGETDKPEITRHHSVAGTYNESVQRKLDSIMKENQELKAIIGKVKVSLKEAVQVNLNLGQIVKLMTENTTTLDEKKDIIRAFSNAKTIAESKALYESYAKSLKEVKAPQKQNIVAESVENPASKQKINETTIYESKEIANMRSLFDRVEKCF